MIMKEVFKKIKNYFKLGQVIEGKVLKIGKSQVWVDLDGMAVGVVRGPELQDELGEYLNLKIDDKVSATIIDEENERGEIELSFRLALYLKTLDSLKKIKEEKTLIRVKVIDANRGGLIVQYKRMQGFVPSSQLSAAHFPQVSDGNKNKILEKLKKLVGKTLEVKIIDVQEPGKKIIFSEREMETEKINSAFKKYQVGDIVEGVVIGISRFGVFVEFGEKIKGLIHISELAWQRVEKIEDIVNLGDKVKAKILSADDSKISLSLKRLTEDPWHEVEKKYKIGDKVKAAILKVTPYGFLVELDKNIQGLAHISEIPEKVLKEKGKAGEKLEFKIISLEPADHRLGLSLK